MRMVSHCPGSSHPYSHREGHLREPSLCRRWWLVTTGHCTKRDAVQFWALNGTSISYSLLPRQRWCGEEGRKIVRTTGSGWLQRNSVLDTTLQLYIGTHSGCDRMYITLWLYIGTQGNCDHMDTTLQLYTGSPGGCDYVCIPLQLYIGTHGGCNYMDTALQLYIGTHDGCDHMYKTCTRPSQTKAQLDREEALDVPPICWATERLLAVNGCQVRESQFSSGIWVLRDSS